MPCPQDYVELHDVKYDFVPIYDVSSWVDCANKCQERDKEVCKFWQYNFDTQVCQLIQSYKYATYSKSANPFTIFGPRDCPASSEILFSRNVNCPEQSGSKSLWIKNGKDIFSQSMTVVDFEEKVVLITSPDGNEIAGQGPSASLPDFPQELSILDGHSMLLIQGDHR